MRGRAWMRALCGSLILGSLSGCGGTTGHLAGGDFGAPVTSQDPGVLVSLLASTTTPEESRKSADRVLVKEKGKEDAARLAVLEQMLYAPGHSDAMRIYAMDQLVDAAPGRAGAALMLYLPKMEPGEVLEHACGVCVALGDERLVEAMVRSIDRVIGNPNLTAEKLRARADWAAIEKLSGGSGDGKAAVAGLYRVIERSRDRSARIAALDVLRVVEGREAVVARIGKMTGEDAWMRDVRWWVGLFETLPIGETESVWVEYLHRPAQAALVSRAVERHGRLKGESDYVFAPRFVAVLAYADAESLGMSRAALLTDLGQRLGALGHVRRTASYAAAEDDVDESLKANEGKLSRMDLVVMRMLLNQLERREVVGELRRQGLEDLSDTTTEHGGLLSLRNVESPALVATVYPPAYAENDLEYVSSDALVQQTVTGIAQYHFHFQQVRNGERAGPGVGDLNYVRGARCDAVVVTSVETRKVDVDFYTPAGAVVDLGVYEGR